MIVIYPNHEAARGRRYPESVSHLLLAVAREMDRDRKRSVEVAFLYPARRLPSGTVIDPSGVRFRMTRLGDDRPYRAISAELKGGQPVMTVLDQLELDRHAISEAAKFLEQQSLATKILDEVRPGVWRGNSRWTLYAELAQQLRAMLKRPKKSKGASRRKRRPAMTRKKQRSKQWQR